MAEPVQLVLLGGSGFVGDAVLRALAADDGACRAAFSTVHALVHRTPLRRDVPGLVLHRGAVDALPQGLMPDAPHVLIHCASKQIDADGSGYGINLAGIEALCAAVTPQTRAVLFLSSYSVYGEDAQRDVDEGAALNPGTALARSRAECEQRLQRLALARNCAVIALRTRFVIGAGDRYVLPGLVKLLRTGLMPGSGQQRYSLIDVDDLARVLLALAGTALPPGFQACNTAYARAISLREIREVMASRMPLRRTRLRLPISATLLKLLGHVPQPALQQAAQRLRLIGLDHYGSVARLAALLQPQRASALLQRDPREAVKAALPAALAEVAA